MSDMPPQPSADTPLPTGSSSTVSGRPAPGPGWIVVAAVALAAMLVGAVAAAGSFLVLSLVGQPQDRYVVTVFLSTDVTAGQKGAVESALSARYRTEKVRLDSAEETSERYREQFEGTLDTTDGTPEEVSESFRVETTGEVFDCAVLAPVERMAGVDLITVVQPPAGDRRYGLLVDCP